MEYSYYIRFIKYVNEYWSILFNFLEPGERIELSTSSLPWKRSTAELPRHTDRKKPGAERGIRTPVGVRQLIYSQLHLATLVSRHRNTNSQIITVSLMEPKVGIEPTTYGLQNRCSTIELLWPSDNIPLHTVPVYRF